MNWCWNVINIVLILLCTSSLAAQEKEEEVKETLIGNHRITIELGHTHLSKGKNTDGKTVWLAVPSWALNYDYWLGNRWAIGLQTDLVIEKFAVEEGEGTTLERNKPLALVAAGIFKPWKHFSIVGGGGIELEKEENLGLSRLGVEYGVELPKSWEAGASLVWDNKWGHYDSWVLGFTFSKVFKKKR